MKPLDQIDFLELSNFLTYTIVFFIIVFLRYFIFSGLYYYCFFILFKDLYKGKVIIKSPILKSQYLKEIKWSAITSLIFGVSIVIMFIVWQKGYTKIYTDLDTFPVWYLGVSLWLYLFIQETYYYWLHRWMHYPEIFKYFHHIHHKSIQTSVLTSFSFHPIESCLQAIIVPLSLLFVPIHIYVLILVLVIMTVTATINHAGVEIYPKNYKIHWFWKWIIGSTHHDQHHKKFNCNYGLFFTFWDKWMGTEKI